MRGPDRVGHGVVDIAAVGSCVATRPPTRQVAAAHKIGQRRRRSVARFGWRIATNDERRRRRMLDARRGAKPDDCPARSATTASGAYNRADMLGKPGLMRG